MWGSSRSSSSRHSRGPILVLAAAAVAALAPPLFLGAIPAKTALVADYDPWKDPDRANVAIEGGDGFFAYLPDRLVAVEEWKRRHLPLWDPYISGGMPLLGLQTANPLDPLIALHFLLPLGRAAGLEYAVLFFAAGLGMILYLRDRGIRAPPALALGGITFAFTPFFLFWMMTRVFLAGLVLLPLALWAGERCLAHPRDLRSGAVLAAAVGYSTVAGTIQTLPLFLLVLLVRLAWVAAQPGRSRGVAAPRLAVAGIAIGLAAGALSLIGGIELYEHSIRTGSAGAYYAGKNYLHWRTFALWFSPGLFGDIAGSPDRVDALLGRTFHGGSGWGALGVLPLGLAVIGGTRSRAPRRERIFWGGSALAVLGLLLLLGTPVRVPLERAWPAFDNMDVFRFLFCLAPAGAVLAAWGTETLLESWSRGERRWLLWGGAYALAGGAVMAAGGWGVCSPDALATAAIPLALVVAGVFALGLGRALPLSLRGWGLVAIAAVELGSLHFRFNRFSPSETAYPPAPAIEVLRRLLDTPGRPRLLVPGHMRSFPTNTASVYGFPDVRGYSNTPVSRYQELIEWAEEQPLTNRTIVYRIKHPVYRLLGGNVIYFTGRYIEESSFSPVDRDLGIYRRKDALPRAFLVHRALVAPNRAGMTAALTSPGFDPGTIAFLEAGFPAPTRLGIPRNGDEFVDITRYEPARIAIHARAAAPAILVVADTFYPGWRATVDGRTTPIFPVDWAVRGIALEPGEHRVVIRYAPPWLVPGVVLTGLALLAMVAGFVLGPRGQNVVT